MIAFKQKGPVNYTVVGSPTIVDGVASGFSSTDYLNISSGYAFNFDTDFELQTKFIPTDVSSAAPLLVGNVATYGGLQLINGKIRFACRQRNTETTTTYTLSGTNNLEINHIYLANVKRVGNTLTLTIYKDGTLLETQTGSLTDILFVQNIVNIRIGYTGTTGAFSGSIDLNETYIKLNGQPWFGTCTTPVSRVRLQGPVGYTVVGSPTIQNGIVSGFSAANKLFVPNFPGGANYEFYVAFKSTLEQQQPIFSIGTGQTTFLRLATNGNLIFYIVFNYTLANAVVLQSGVGTISANTDYIVKLRGYNGTHTMSLSSDGGETWTQLDSLTGDYSLPSGTINFGSALYLYNYYYTGSIDLNDTYVRVNNKLWFGKEPVKKIVKDGVTVWEEV